MFAEVDFAEEAAAQQITLSLLAENSEEGFAAGESNVFVAEIQDLTPTITFLLAEDQSRGRRLNLRENNRKAARIGIILSHAPPFNMVVSVTVKAAAGQDPFADLEFLIDDNQGGRSAAACADLICEIPVVSGGRIGEFYARAKVDAIENEETFTLEILQSDNPDVRFNINGSESQFTIAVISGELPLAFTEQAIEVRRERTPHRSPIEIIGTKPSGGTLLMRLAIGSNSADSGFGPYHENIAHPRGPNPEYTIDGCVGSNGVLNGVHRCNIIIVDAANPALVIHGRDSADRGDVVKIQIISNEGNSIPATQQQIAANADAVGTLLTVTLSGPLIADFYDDRKLPTARINAFESIAMELTLTLNENLRLGESVTLSFEFGGDAIRGADYRFNSAAQSSVGPTPNCSEADGRLNCIFEVASAEQSVSELRLPITIIADDAREDTKVANINFAALNPAGGNFYRRGTTNSARRRILGALHLNLTIRDAPEVAFVESEIDFMAGASGEIILDFHPAFRTLNRDQLVSLAIVGGGDDAPQFTTDIIQTDETPRPINAFQCLPERCAFPLFAERPPARARVGIGIAFADSLIGRKVTLELQPIRFSSGNTYLTFEEGAILHPPGAYNVGAQSRIIVNVLEPSVDHSAADKRTISEGGDAIPIQLQITGELYSRTEIKLAASGDAQLGGDYILRDSIGEQLSCDENDICTLPINDAPFAYDFVALADGAHEGIEEVILSVAAGENYAAGETIIEINIANAEFAMSFDSESAAAFEGDNLQIPVSPPAGIIRQGGLTLKFEVEDEGDTRAQIGADFTVQECESTSCAIIFEDGEDAVIGVNINTDLITNEEVESFALKLIDGDGYVAGDNNRFVINIAESKTLRARTTVDSIYWSEHPKVAAQMQLIPPPKIRTVAQLQLSAPLGVGPPRSADNGGDSSPPIGGRAEANSGFEKAGVRGDEDDSFEIGNQEDEVDVLPVDDSLPIIIGTTDAEDFACASGFPRGENAFIGDCAAEISEGGSLADISFSMRDVGLGRWTLTMRLLPLNDYEFLPGRDEVTVEILPLAIGFAGLGQQGGLRSAPEFTVTVTLGPDFATPTPSPFEATLRAVADPAIRLEFVDSAGVDLPACGAQRESNCAVLKAQKSTMEFVVRADTTDIDEEKDVRLILSDPSPGPTPYTVGARNELIRTVPPPSAIEFDSAGARFQEGEGIIVQLLLDRPAMDDFGAGMLFSGDASPPLKESVSGESHLPSAPVIYDYNLLAERSEIICGNRPAESEACAFSLAFPHGETTRAFTITAAADGRVEAVERITITLIDESVNYRLGQNTAFVAEIENTPFTVAFADEEGNAIESGSGAAVANPGGDFIARLTPVNVNRESDLTIQFELFDTLQPESFLPEGCVADEICSVVIPADSPFEITLPVPADTRVIGREFNLRLMDGEGYAAADGVLQVQINSNPGIRFRREHIAKPWGETAIIPILFYPPGIAEETKVTVSVFSGGAQGAEFFEDGNEAALQSPYDFTCENDLCIGVFEENAETLEGFLMLSLAKPSAGKEIVLTLLAADKYRTYNPTLLTIASEKLEVSFSADSGTVREPCIQSAAGCLRIFDFDARNPFGFARIGATLKINLLANKSAGADYAVSMRADSLDEMALSNADGTPADCTGDVCSFIIAEGNRGVEFGIAAHGDAVRELNEFFSLEIIGGDEYDPGADGVFRGKIEDDLPARGEFRIGGDKSSVYPEMAASFQVFMSGPIGAAAAATLSIVSPHEFGRDLLANKSCRRKTCEVLNIAALSGSSNRGRIILKASPSAVGEVITLSLVLSPGYTPTQSAVFQVGVSAPLRSDLAIITVLAPDVGQRGGSALVGIGEFAALSLTVGGQTAIYERGVISRQSPGGVYADIAVRLLIKSARARLNEDFSLADSRGEILSCDNISGICELPIAPAKRQTGFGSAQVASLHRARIGQVDYRLIPSDSLDEVKLITVSLADGDDYNALSSGDFTVAIYPHAQIQLSEPRAFFADDAGPPFYADDVGVVEFDFLPPLERGVTLSLSVKSTVASAADKFGASSSWNCGGDLCRRILQASPLNPLSKTEFIFDLRDDSFTANSKVTVGLDSIPGYEFRGGNAFVVTVQLPTIGVWNQETYTVPEGESQRLSLRIEGRLHSPANVALFLLKDASINLEEDILLRRSDGSSEPLACRNRGGSCVLPIGPTATITHPAAGDLPVPVTSRAFYELVALPDDKDEALEFAEINVDPGEKYTAKGGGTRTQVLIEDAPFVASHIADLHYSGEPPVWGESITLNVRFAPPDVAVEELGFALMSPDLPDAIGDVEPMRNNNRIAISTSFNRVAGGQNVRVDLVITPKDFVFDAPLIISVRNPTISFANDVAEEKAIGEGESESIRLHLTDSLRFAGLLAVKISVSSGDAEFGVDYNMQERSDFDCVSVINNEGIADGLCELRISPGGPSAAGDVQPILFSVLADGEVENDQRVTIHLVSPANSGYDTGLERITRTIQNHSTPIEFAGTTATNNEGEILRVRIRSSIVQSERVREEFLSGVNATVAVETNLALPGFRAAIGDDFEFADCPDADRCAVSFSEVQGEVQGEIALRLLDDDAREAAEEFFALRILSGDSHVPVPPKDLIILSIRDNQMLNFVADPSAEWGEDIEAFVSAHPPPTSPANVRVRAMAPLSLSNAPSLSEITADGDFSCGEFIRQSDAFAGECTATIQPNETRANLRLSANALALGGWQLTLELLPTPDYELSPPTVSTINVLPVAVGFAVAESTSFDAPERFLLTISVAADSHLSPLTITMQESADVILKNSGGDSIAESCGDNCFAISPSASRTKLDVRLVDENLLSGSESIPLTIGIVPPAGEGLRPYKATPQSILTANVQPVLRASLIIKKTSIREGDENGLTFKISFNRPPLGNVPNVFVLLNGNATPSQDGADYRFIEENGFGLISDDCPDGINCAAIFNIAPGERERTIKIVALADGIIDENESFSMRLGILGDPPIKANEERFIVVEPSQANITIEEATPIIEMSEPRAFFANAAGPPFYKGDHGAVDISFDPPISGKMTVSLVIRPVDAAEQFSLWDCNDKGDCRLEIDGSSNPVGRARFNFHIDESFAVGEKINTRFRIPENYVFRGLRQFAITVQEPTISFVGKSAPALAAEIAEGEIAGIQLLIDGRLHSNTVINFKRFINTGSGGANPIFADASDFRLRTAGKAEEISCDNLDCEFPLTISATATQLGVGQLPVPISGLIDWEIVALPDRIVEPGRPDNFGGNKDLVLFQMQDGEGYQSKENHNGIQIAIVDAPRATGVSEIYYGGESPFWGDRVTLYVRTIPENTGSGIINFRCQGARGNLEILSPAQAEISGNDDCSFAPVEGLLMTITNEPMVIKFGRSAAGREFEFGNLHFSYNLNIRPAANITISVRQPIVSFAGKSASIVKEGAADRVHLKVASPHRVPDDITVRISLSSSNARLGVDYNLDSPSINCNAEEVCEFVFDEGNLGGTPSLPLSPGLLPPISFAAVADGELESDKKVTMQILAAKSGDGYAVGGAAARVKTIENDLQLRFAEVVTAAEGELLIAEITPPSGINLVGGYTVTFSVDNNFPADDERAIIGEDFQIQGCAGGINCAVTIGIGEQSGLITVQLISDGVKESAFESFALRISDGEGYSPHPVFSAQNYRVRDSDIVFVELPAQVSWNEAAQGAFVIHPPPSGLIHLEVSIYAPLALSDAETINGIVAHIDGGQCVDEFTRQSRAFVARCVGTAGPGQDRYNLQISTAALGVGGFQIEVEPLLAKRNEPLKAFSSQRIAIAPVAAKFIVGEDGSEFDASSEFKVTVEIAADSPLQPFVISIQRNATVAVARINGANQEPQSESCGVNCFAIPPTGRRTELQISVTRDDANRLIPLTIKIPRGREIHAYTPESPSEIRAMIQPQVP